LIRAHFEGKDTDGNLRERPDLPGDIEREGRLSDRWTRRDDL
jgi:hypothetical protein